jgi:outer membrane protein OmpA-like peptidoglycan-associated protein
MRSIVLRPQAVVLAAVLSVAALGGCAKRPWTRTSAPLAEPPEAKQEAGAPAPTAPSASVPAPAPGQPKEFRGHEALRDVSFRPGQLAVVKADAPILDANAGWLKERPDWLVLSKGTPTTGTRRTRT